MREEQGWKVVLGMDTGEHGVLAKRLQCWLFIYGICGLHCRMSRQAVARPDTMDEKGDDGESRSVHGLHMAPADGCNTLSNYNLASLAKCFVSQNSPAPVHVDDPCIALPIADEDVEGDGPNRKNGLCSRRGGRCSSTCRPSCPSRPLPSYMMIVVSISVVVLSRA